ncbi:hypothetical protein [Kaustia mangrovi]|uniref:hypothetical protein n=1 Tax=Kaustia mangrovi TaxID=2593653 RepID=UPI001FE5EED7|nr:hypothetical protein [Kaustia mangrovi]
MEVPARFGAQGVPSGAVFSSSIRRRVWLSPVAPMTSRRSPVGSSASRSMAATACASPSTSADMETDDI